MVPPFRVEEVATGQKLEEKKISRVKMMSRVKRNESLEYRYVIADDTI